MATPINNNLFNQSFGIHIMPLVIDSLEGGHTCKCTHILTLQTKAILRNQAHASLLHLVEKLSKKGENSEVIHPIVST